MATEDEITTFSLSIETLAYEKRLSYLEAVIHYCQLNNLEVELAARLLSGAIKAKLQKEAEELHFLPKSRTNRLPI